MRSKKGEITTAILDKAGELGVSLAGIAAVRDLKASKSYEIYDKKPFYEEYKGVEWPEQYKSVLAFGLEHPRSNPVLDWWSMKVPGFTPGNRILRQKSRQLRIWLEEELGIGALSLPYQIEYGGVLLKDASVLAGLGTIGRHNLLVTPEFGTRVRLRGLFIEAELEPTGPIDFDPCSGCDGPCQKVCPRKAFPDGKFERDLCRQETDLRDATMEMLDGEVMGIEVSSLVAKYCRKCEFACPVGRKK